MTRRALGGFALGASAGLAAAWARGGLGVGRPGSPAAWVADRAAHAVYGLDADAIVVLRFDVRAPVAVALPPSPLVAEADGTSSAVKAQGRAAALRVVSALDARADGRFALFDLDGAGRVLRSQPCGAPGRLPPVRWAAAFEARDPARISWCEQRRGARRLLWIARPEDDGAERAVLERWVERAEGARRVLRRTVPGAVGHLVGDRGGEVDFVGARRLVITRFDNSGRIVRIAHHADAEGACAAARDRTGVCWIAARGALVRVDRTGKRRPGQGGFADLVDVELDVGLRAPKD